MKILVTGATGFVGSHTVAALVLAGHQVRALVRSPERLAPALAPLGAPQVDAAVGDITDEASVEKALSGCDAVLHAAAVYSLDSRASGRIRDQNVRGAEVVLGTAHRLRLSKIVHVSSYVALLSPNGKNLTADSPVGDPGGPYSRSKVQSDQVARKLQEAGAPVVISYPGAAWGPNDPNFGEAPQLVRNILLGRLPVVPSGSIPLVDVRDVAKLHAALFDRPLQARRYLVCGHRVSIGDLIRHLGEATGRKIAAATVPAWMALASGRAAQMFQRLFPVRLPLNYEAIYFSVLDPLCDDSAMRAELGLEPRPLQETFVDMVSWLVEQGQIPEKKAGRLGRPVGSR